VSELSLNLRNDVVNVLLRCNLSVCDRLDSGVVMMLVNFSVNSLLSLLVSVWLDNFLNNGGVHNLVDIGSVTSSAGDLADCCSCCLHLETWE